MNMLNHLAIIMDGNGRWAKNRGFLRTKGHAKGADVVQMVIEFCIKNKIQILSLYAFSTENWRRPKNEIDFLLKLLKDFLSAKKDEFLKNDIKFQTIGDISIFDDELKNEIQSLQNTTQHNSKLKFNLAINYGGKDEIIRAIKRTIENNDEINETNISKNLDESTDIDLLIRTGNENRISNFMLWQASYAEIYYSQTLWPDFTQNDLEKIVQDFRHKQRRFGGL